MLKLFLTIVVLGAIAGYCADQERQHIDDHTTLLIHAKGPLPETPTPDWAHVFDPTGLPAVPALIDAIEKAAHDTRIQGVLLHVESPEWGLAQVHELEPAFETLRTQGKWAIAYMDSGTEMGSSDLMIEVALLADEIVMSPVGSIDLRGAGAHVPFVGNLMQRLKVEPYFDARKEFKSMPNTFTRNSMSPTQKQDLQQLVTDLQHDIETRIAARRKLDINAVKNFYQQPSMTAAEAVNAKLIDRASYWDEVTNDIKQRTQHDDVHLLDVNEYIMRTAEHTPAHDHVMALITAEGSIVTGSDDEAMEGNVTSGVIQQALRDARENEVEGVLLRVDSPGGSYVASDLMRREIELTRKAGIPVVVSMGNMAASGGYFIAMQGDHIVADPATITGSIGVFSGTFATRKLLADHLGITFDSVQATPKATAQGIDAPNEQEKADMTKSLDAIYADFVSKAAAGRKMKESDLEPLARGRIYTGRRAQSVGLVDELGGITHAMTALKQRANLAPDAAVQFDLYPEPPSPFTMLQNMVHPGANAFVNPLMRGIMRDPWGLLRHQQQLHMAPLKVTP